MSTKTVNQLSETTSPLGTGDLIIIEKASGGGTKKMTYSEFVKAVAASMVTRSTAVTDELHVVDAKELNSSITGSIAENLLTVNSNLVDYIKAVKVTIPLEDMSKGMNLTQYAEIDTGYKFISWDCMGVTTGWTTAVPIYVSSPTTINGSPYWSGDLPTSTSGKSVSFVFYEIRNI